jgi:hypothetical protein
MSGNSLVGGMSDLSSNPERLGPGPACPDAAFEREPTYEELIEAIRASNLRARAIEGTDADPLVQVERMIERRAEEDERRYAAYVRSQRWRRLSPFPWHWK